MFQMLRTGNAQTKHVLFWLLFILNSRLESNAIRHHHLNNDISLWIDERQIAQFSGFKMNIFAIIDGDVLSYVLDPNFEKYLPVIPAEVHTVNFTWRSGLNKVYYYNFDRLRSFNPSILDDPIINVERAGKIPTKASQFQVRLPCHSNVTGIGQFEVGLLIENEQGGLLPGTPLRLRLKKYCAQKEPDSLCGALCTNGQCDHQNICVCYKGYVGKHCENALCYPQCLNGGICTRPGVCTCPDGYQGPHCEGGICTERCQNGGKCMQKDTCECTRGYFGARCTYSKCSIPCLNKGRCIGVNKCKCRRAYYGNQCEFVNEIQLAKLNTTLNAYRKRKKFV